MRLGSALQLLKLRFRGQRALIPLLHGFTTLTVLLVLALVAGGGIVVRSLAIQNEEESLGSLAESMASKTESLLSQMNYAFSTLERWLLAHPEADPRRDPEFAGYVTTFKASMDGLVDMRVANAQGDLSPVPPEPIQPDSSVGDRSFFLRQTSIATMGFDVGDPFMNPLDGTWVIPVSYPLMSRDSGIVMFVGMIQVTRFLSIYKAFLPLKGGALAILHGDGKILLTLPFNPELLGRSLRIPPSLASFRKDSMGDDVVSHESGLDGRRRITAYHSIDYGRLVIAVSSEERKVLNRYWSFAPILGTGAILVLVFLIFVSSRIQVLLKELRLARTELETSVKSLEANRIAKDKLFSIISHDLRGPLGGMRSLLETLVQERGRMGEKDLDESLAALLEAAGSTSSLLEDLLAWFNSQRTSLIFRPTAMALSPLVAEAFLAVQPQATAKGIGLEMRMDEACPVYADENMLATILRNLVSNGVKYSQRGGKVLVEASAGPEGTKIAVIDQGLGMDEATRERLFDPTVLKSRPGTAGEKGTGLGLQVVKDFVERHGGKLGVESRPGEGSSFSFVLPAATAATATAATAAAATARGRT